VFVEFVVFVVFVCGVGSTGIAMHVLFTHIWVALQDPPQSVGSGAIGS
jgi:hypothetical protein